MIHILFTGGTISMQRDADAGGNMPVHSGEALMRLVPGVERIAPLRIEDWARMPACHFDQARLWALRERVRALSASDGVRGIVITHGTDILEETAYLLDRTLDRRIPVAITGAMRTSSDEGWDGPGNLRDAVTVAASAASAGRGAMVVFAGQVFAGRTAAKTHATDPDAFSAPHGGPIGGVVDGEVRYSAEPPRAGAPLEPASLHARVAHVPSVVGDQGTMLELARGDHEYLSPELIRGFDLYLSFAGGPSLTRLERQFGARRARALYCAVDPAIYRPLRLPRRFDLGYLGTWSADRQPKLEQLLLEPARRCPEGRFAVAGPQYPADVAWPENVGRIEHVPPHRHRAFYAGQRFTLNITRADMVAAGYSPSVRLFEAAACGTPIISDTWRGLDRFFTPAAEILLSRNSGETLAYLREIPEADRRDIGLRARAKHMKLLMAVVLFIVSALMFWRAL